MKKTNWKRVCALLLSLILICAAGGTALSELALRAYVNSFNASSSGIEFTVGAQNGSGNYTFNYSVSGPVSGSGTVSGAGKVSLPSSLADKSGDYRVTVSANDGSSTANASLTASYNSTTGVTVSGASYPIKYVTDVELNKTTLTLETGKDEALTATIMPVDAANKNVRYTTSNAAVATVADDGTITAIAPGTCSIICTAQDGTGKSDTCAVTVVCKAQSVSVSPEDKVIIAGQTAQLTPTVLPAQTTDKSVTYRSNNTDVATVDANGLITAVAPGNCAITCKTADGTEKTAACNVTVIRKAASVTLNRSAQTLTIGQKFNLTATVLPADTTLKDVDFATSNATVATVTGAGEVTAVANGTAVITVTTQDGSSKSAQCIVTVGTKVTSITVWPLSLNLTTGDTHTMQYAALPSNASNKGVVWTSSNTANATVDGLGKVTAYKAGTVTITATAMDGSGISDSCTVIITGEPISTATPTATTAPTTAPTSGTSTTAPTTKPTTAPTAVPGSANIKAQVVTEDGGLNLRVDSRKSSKRLLVIPQYANLIVNVYGKTWCHVTYNGTSGYVMTQFLSIGSSTVTAKPTGTSGTTTPKPSGSGNAQVKTASGGLNLRTSASKSARRLLIIPQNAYVTVTAYGSTWCALTYNGVSGYAMTKFLSVSGSVSGGGSSTSTTAPSATKPVSGAGKQYAQVTTASGGLNLRTSASLAAKRIAIIPRNGYLLVNTYGTTWSYITYNDVSGYVMTKFLTLI